MSQAPPPKSPNDRRTKDFKELSGVGYVGLFFGFAVAIGAWLGGWVDEKLGTDPWGLTLGAIFGSVAGFRELYRVAMRAQRDVDRDPDG